MVLTEQQAMIRDSAARFAAERLAPEQQEVGSGKAPSMPEVLREMGQARVHGNDGARKTYRGAGLDYVSYALALIEIAAGDGAVSTIMSVNNAPVCAILAVGCQRGA